MDDQCLCTNIVENAGDAVIFADTEGTIRFWNEAAERVFGYSTAEALGDSLDIIIPDKLTERHWAGYSQAMQRGHTAYEVGEVLAVPAVRKNDDRISVEFTVSLLQDAQDDIVGVAAIVRDVTDRWEKEQERKARIQELESQLD